MEVDPYMNAGGNGVDSRPVLIYPVEKSKCDSVVYKQREKLGLVNTGVELMCRVLPYS